MNELNDTYFIKGDYVEIAITHVDKRKEESVKKHMGEIMHVEKNRKSQAMIYYVHVPTLHTTLSEVAIFPIPNIYDGCLHAFQGKYLKLIYPAGQMEPSWQNIFGITGWKPEGL